MYFDKERHVFEGFCVPDFVRGYWVGKEEMDGLGSQEKKTEREGGRKYKKDGKASRGSHRKAERKTD